MEGTAVSVHWVCASGGWAGRECCEHFFLIVAALCRAKPLLPFLQAVLVLKYILNGYPEQYTYYGYANVSQNVALMLSAVVLWIAQSESGEYEYSLTL